MSTSPAPTAPAETAPLSEGARIVNTFIAPSKTFADLRRKASWWVPWLIISVFSLIFIYTVDRQVGFEQITQNEIAKSPKRAEQIEKLPADQQANNLRISTTIRRYASYAVPILALIGFLVIAVVLWATFSLAAGAAVPFPVALAIVIYGSLPSIFHVLLGTISLIAGSMSGALDKAAYNIQNPVATNPAYFLDPTGNKFVYGIASALDVFMLWTIVLIGIGFAANGKVKRGTAIGIVLGWYILYKLIGAGTAVAFS